MSLNSLAHELSQQKADNLASRWNDIRQRADKLSDGCFDMLYENHASANSMRKLKTNYRSLESVLNAMERDLVECELRVQRFKQRNATNA